MKPYLCLYHSHCADGFGAAWVVRRALGDAVEFIPAEYGMSVPDVTARHVIIVDFSFDYATLTAMAETATAVVVLDHHKTSAEALSAITTDARNWPQWQTDSAKLGAVFDMQRSGAGLTWDFFFPEQARPDLINHIEDRDLWQFKLPNTREIQAALFSYPYDFEVWDQLIDAPPRLITEGQAIERKHHKDVAELVGKSKRRMIIGGHNVPAANLPYTLTSDAGMLMAQGEPFAACYMDMSDHRYFSLRSTDQGLDVGEVAKQYNGGGHRNAAGFKVPFTHELVTGHVTATLENSPDHECPPGCVDCH